MGSDSENDVLPGNAGPPDGQPRNGLGCVGGLRWSLHCFSSVLWL